MPDPGPEATPSAGTRPAPSPERRARILEAAERLFAGYGYRAVTMTRIADEAGMSKATLYAYFADREDVFRNVAGAVADRIARAVEDGLAGPGTTTERVTRALQAKDRLIYETAVASPHAAELFEAKDRLVRALFEDTDRTILGAVGRALDDGTDRGLPRDRLARIVVRASRGLAVRADNAEALARDIAALVERLLA